MPSKSELNFVIPDTLEGSMSSPDGTQSITPALVVDDAIPSGKAVSQVVIQAANEPMNPNQASPMLMGVISAIMLAAVVAAWFRWFR
jgi:hypothetical protein